MNRQTPRSTRTDTLCPDTTVFRSDQPQLALQAQAVVVVDADDAAAVVVRGIGRIPGPVGEPPADLPMAVVEIVAAIGRRSEEHTSELQSLMRISYAVFCLKKKTTQIK